MKNFTFKTCCLLIGFFFIPEKNFASHVVGGEVGYEYISPQKWKVKLVVYEDCHPQATSSVGCSSMVCTKSMLARPTSLPGLNPQGTVATPSQITFNVSLVSVEDVGKTAVEFCGNSAKNMCTNLGQTTAGLNGFGAQRYYFEGILDMNIGSLSDPNTPPYWDIFIDFCCRSADIFNLDAPEAQNFRLFSTLNVFDRPNMPSSKNSPVLTNEPFILACSGKIHSYSLGAIDPDEDSLSYEFAPAMQSGGIEVVYAPPFSYYYPFPLNSTAAPHTNFPQPNGPYLIMDSSRGDISFNPVQNSPNPIESVINVRIKQWKNDSLGKPFLTGITHREILVYSVSCHSSTPAQFNNNPYLQTTTTAQGGGTSFDYAVVAGEQLCFNITAKDPDVFPNDSRFDTTFIRWNNGIERPGKLTFAPAYPVADSIPRPREDEWQFCWQTEESDGRALPYSFTVSAFDKFCPLIGQTAKTIRIRVVPTPIYTTLRNNLNCSRVQLGMIKEQPQQTWSYATVEVAVAPNDWTFSNGKKIISISNINPTFQSNNPVKVFNDTLQFAAPGSYLVKYVVTISDPGTAVQNTKIVFDTIVITGQAILPAIIADDHIQCITNNHFNLTYTVNDTNIAHTRQWFLADNNTSNNHDVSVNYLTPGTKKIFLVLSAQGCDFTTSTELHVLPKPIITDLILVNDSTQCVAVNDFRFTYKKLNDKSTFTHTWFAEGTIRTDTLLRHSFTTAGFKTVKLAIGQQEGCSDTATKIVEVTPKPIVQNLISVNDSAQCLNNQMFTFSFSQVNPPVHFHHLWNTGNALYTDSVISITFPDTGIKRVLLIGEMNGCYDSAFKDVSVIASPVIDSISGPVTGLSVLTDYQYSVPSVANHTYAWNITNGLIMSGTGPNSNAITVQWLTAGTGSLKVIQLNQKCADTAILNVSVGNVGLNTIGKQLYDVEIIPNPSNGYFNLSLNSPYETVNKLVIFSAHGLKVHEENIELNKGNNLIAVDKTLVPGIYFLTLAGKEGSVTKRLLIR